MDAASEVSEEVAKATIREQPGESLPSGWKVLSQIHHKNVQKIAIVLERLSGGAKLRLACIHGAPRATASTVWLSAKHISKFTE